MSKRTYDVSAIRVGSFSGKKKDSSFAACLCTMLVILVICSLLLLLSFTFRRVSSKKEIQSDKKKFERITSNNTQQNEGYTKIHEKEETTQHTTESTTIFSTSIEFHPSTKQTTFETTVSEEPETTESEGVVTTENLPTTYNTETDHRFNEDISEKTTSAGTISENTATSLIFHLEKSTDIVSDSTTFSTSISKGNTDDSRNTVTEVMTTSQPTEHITSLDEETTTKIAIPETENTSHMVSTSRLDKETMITSSYSEDITESRSESTTEGTEKAYNEMTTRDGRKSTYYDTTTEQSTTFKESDYVDTNMDSREEENSTERYDVSNTLIFKDKDTCTSRKCNKEAARIISSMDTSEKACDDFYNYACGGILVDDVETIDIFRPDVLERKSPGFLKDFKDFYESCRNYDDRFIYKDRMATLFDVLRRSIYGYDVIKDINLMLSNMMLLESFPFLDIGIGVNPVNSSTFILELRKPKYTPSNLQYWSSFSGYQRKCSRKSSEKLNSDARYFFDEYLKCHLNFTDLLTTIQSLREENNKVLDLNPTTEEIKQASETVSKWIVKINQPKNTSYETLNNVMTISDLQGRYPLSNLSWMNILSNLTDVRVNDDTPIMVEDEEHLQILKEEFENMSERELINFLNVIALVHIYENIVLPSHVESRTEFCRGLTKYMHPDIVNYLYRNLSYSRLDEERRYIDKIFNHFKQQFNISLQESEWIDDDSKTAMIDKLGEIKLSFFETDSLVEEENNLERFASEKDYVSNLMASMGIKNRRFFSLHGQEVTTDRVYRYLLSASSDEPLYIESSKMAYIPFGLMQKASKELPDYLVMAQVGFPLARIIGKAFSLNNFMNIKMSPKTSEKYQDFIRRMSYDGTFSRPFKFNDRFLHFKDDNKPYLDDLIADNIAMRLLTERKETFGMQSLLPWISYEFSREKIFFLGLSQEFCRKKEIMDVVIQTYQNRELPPPTRVDNILSHSEEFSRHFDCDNQSPIFRPEKIQFPYINITFDVGLLN